jgi:replicative DNA helicase
MNCGCPVAFYSMEMKKEQIAARMISIASGVPANEILYSKLDGGQIQMIDRGVAKVENLPVYFDDRSTSNIETILSSIRMMKIKYGIKGVVVDYLQILNVNMKGSNKEQQMGDVARRLKNIAKELDIWVIALSQLNRDAQNPVPSLARLRDSGQIAEAADMVILIYRPEIYGKRYPEEFSDKSTAGTAMIDVAKGRNVGLMKFIVGFRKENTNFYDLDDVPAYEIKENRPDGLPF